MWKWKVIYSLLNANDADCQGKTRVKEFPLSENFISSAKNVK